MSSRQKKTVSFKDSQDSKTNETKTEIKKEQEEQEIKNNEPQFDYNVNYLVLKYKSLIKRDDKDIIYAISDISKHQAEYNLDIQIYWNEISEHQAYIESNVAEMEYHIALHIQKNDNRVDKKKEKNKLIIEKEYKDLEYHKLKNNLKIADAYGSLIFHKVKNYSKIVQLLTELHEEMNSEYSNLQKLFTDSKCTLREEWQEYIKPLIDQLYEINNKKETNIGILNMLKDEKINHFDVIENEFFKSVQKSEKEDEDNLFKKFDLDSDALILYTSGKILSK